MSAIDETALDAETAERIQYECSHGDAEGAHGRADELLIELLQKLGYTKTANAWDAVDKWYA